ncbi:NnrU family protein [bacterium]|nr:NnrU family protein [bacterium]
MQTWMILLGWILFAGTHIGLSTQNIRSGLTTRMGEKGFQGFYSLIALVTFAFLIAAFYFTKSTGERFLAAGSDHPAAVYICNILMLFAFILLFSGFTDRTPMGMVPTEAKARGIIRITRHPMNMAFALFGLAHLLTNRFAADWFFYSGFVLYGYLGSYHQDRKKMRTAGQPLADFVTETSILPFGAVISGRQPFKPGEISKIGLLLGIIVAIIVRILHPSV